MRKLLGSALMLAILSGSGGLAAQNERETEADVSEARTLPQQPIGQIVLPDNPAIRTLSPDVLRNALQGQSSVSAEVPDASVQSRLNLEQIRAQVGPAGKIQLFNDAGSGSTVDEAARSLNVKPGDLLTIQNATAAPAVTQAGGLKTTASSTRLLLVEEDGRLRDLQMVHLSEGLGWRSESSQFEGELLIGVLDRNDPGYSAPLSGRTIPVQLMTGNGQLSSDSLALKRIGQPYEKVEVKVEFPDDPFAVRLVSQVDEHLPVAELEVQRPELSISGPDRLMGLGIGAGTVLVSGKNTRLAGGDQIVLKLSQGWPDTMTLSVDADGVARGRVRSDWVGDGILSLAPSGVYRADAITIEYGTPARFIIASVLGAMLGALVFVYRRWRAGDRSRKVLLFDWLVGTLVGGIVPLMAYTGFNLPQWLPIPDALTGEAVPFVLAFLAAAAGTAMIDWVAGRGRSAA